MDFVIVIVIESSSYPSSILLSFYRRIAHDGFFSYARDVGRQGFANVYVPFVLDLVVCCSGDADESCSLFLR